jgi:hypothetical protein
MANDGENIYLLKPRKDRKKYTKAELEEILFNEVLNSLSRSSQIDISQNPAWSLAVENDIKLKDHQYYSDPNNMDREVTLAFIDKASKHRLESLAQYAPKALENHSQALMSYIKKKDISAMGALEKYAPHLLQNDQEAKAAIEFYFLDEISKADPVTLGILFSYTPQTIENYPEAWALLKLRFIEAINNGDSQLLRGLAQFGSRVFQKYPEALMAFINKADKYGLGALANYLPDLFENKEAFKAYLNKADMYSIKKLGEYTFRKHQSQPAAMIAVLKKFRKFSDKKDWRYREATEVFNHLLNISEDQLRELFLSTKEGKEILVWLAKDKDFTPVNEWLQKTKRSLPSETLALINQDPHQRVARESLPYSSSNPRTRDCIRLLQQVSLKYAQ